MNELEEVKQELKETREKLKIKINTEIIKALELKKGHKYVIFFGKKCGLKPLDISRLEDPLFENTMFILDDIKNLSLYQKDIDKHITSEIAGSTTS